MLFVFCGVFGLWFGVVCFALGVLCCYLIVWWCLFGWGFGWCLIVVYIWYFVGLFCLFVSLNDCLDLCDGLLSLFRLVVDCLCCVVVMLLRVHCLLLHDVWFGVWLWFGWVWVGGFVAYDWVGVCCMVGWVCGLWLFEWLLGFEYRLFISLLLCCCLLLCVVDGFCICAVFDWG